MFAQECFNTNIFPGPWHCDQNIYAFRMLVCFGTNREKKDLISSVFIRARMDCMVFTASCADPAVSLASSKSLSTPFLSVSAKLYAATVGSDASCLACCRAWSAQMDVKYSRTRCHQARVAARPSTVL